MSKVTNPPVTLQQHLTAITNQAAARGITAPEQIGRLLQDAKDRWESRIASN